MLISAMRGYSGIFAIALSLSGYAACAFSQCVSRFDQMLSTAGEEHDASHRGSDLKRLDDLVNSMSGDERRNITNRQVDRLAFFLRDDSDLVRMYAAIALGRIGKPAKRVLPALEFALKNRSRSSSIVTDPDLGSDSAIQAAMIKINATN